MLIRQEHDIYNLTGLKISSKPKYQAPCISPYSHYNDVKISAMASQITSLTQPFIQGENQ